jgi:SAM-dependent methyltransferase
MVYAGEYGDPEAIYVDGYLKGETDFGLNIMEPLFQEYLDWAAECRLAAIERAAGGPGRLLDVGCGSGELIRVAGKRGWTAAGVEPVKESASIAIERGLDVSQAMLQDSGRPERGYDVVSAFHVLEHMSEATEFLKMIARWARPGGYVAIEVPNWRSFHRLNSGQGWPGLRPLEHIGHYTPATLEATLGRAGLNPVKVRTMTFLWEKQTLDQVLGDLARPRWARWLRPLSVDGEQKGEPAKVPGRAVWAMMHGVQAAYDVAKVGQVVLGIGQVPA